MTKVGIFTWYGTDNYGSNLQAIGLSTKLDDMGYSPFFVDRFKVKISFVKHPIMVYARLLNKLNQDKKKAFFSPVPYELSMKRRDRLSKFKADNFVSKSYYNSNDWKEDIKNRTIFVCGSDILWNPARGYPAMNFLDFAYYAKLSRFSYGSSIGALEVPKKYNKAYKRYLGSMVDIGVREQAVADMLEPIIGRKVTKVVDPSLLLTSSDWDQYAVQSELSVDIDKRGFILCYFVMHDPRYWEYVKKVKEESNLQIIVLPMHQLDEDQPYDVITDGTLPEFIWLVKNAEFVCTDSFHACVLSTIYEKEFYLLRRTRKAEDAKYNDFLTRYRLEDRSVSDESQFERSAIDFTFARQKIAEDRVESLKFLQETLEKCK